MTDKPLTIHLPERMHEADRALVIEAHTGLMEWVHGGGPHHLKVAFGAVRCLLIRDATYENNGECWDGHGSLCL